MFLGQSMKGIFKYSFVKKIGPREQGTAHPRLQKAAAAHTAVDRGENSRLSFRDAHRRLRTFRSPLTDPERFRPVVAIPFLQNSFLIRECAPVNRYTTRDI